MAAVLVMTLAACHQDEAEPVLSDGAGIIVLSMGDTQLFTELQTRSEVAVSDLSRYTFTLNGKTIGGATVSNLPLDVASDGTAQVNAGTYTITATNADYANTGYGHPYYNGTSEEFEISVNETLPVSISLGKPKNARITMAIDDSFSALYDSPTLSISDGNRTLELTTEIECFFTVPASGALAYTITADALPGSLVTDIAGSTGYVEVQNGYNTTIRLKAHPATGVVIPVVEGEHAGTFDVKKR